MVSLVVDAEQSLEAVYQARRRCGLGFELALLLPLMWLHRSRKRIGR